MTLYTNKLDCRLCSSNSLKKRIELSPLPVASPNIQDDGAESMGMEAPVDVMQCEDCGFLQLSVVVNPEYQYKNFLYKTNISLGLKEHFKSILDHLRELNGFTKGCSVFEVGSNDGSFLELAKDQGAKILGIDPAVKIAQEATDKGIPTLGDFFSHKKAGEIKESSGQFDVIVSNNTIANIDNLVDIFDGFQTLLTDDGLLVIETQYALDVLEKNLLDVIYHEHISYFLVEPMQAFLKRVGFELIDAVCIEPKGGSIRFVAQSKRGKRPINPRVAQLIRREHESGVYNQELFTKFNLWIKQTGDDLRKRLDETKRLSGTGLVYGSSVGCSALIHFFKIDTYIDAIFDDYPLRDFLLVKDRKIPVYKGEQLAEYPPTEIAVLAWRYMDSIVKKNNSYVEKGGSFYSPL